MPSTIQSRANSLISAKKPIKDADVSKLQSMAEKDNKITPVEAKALSKVAALKDDRFVKGTSGEVSGAVDDIRSVAATAKELLDAKVVVHSTVPNLKIAFEKAVNVTPDDGYGASYERFLNLTMKGNTASKDGSVSFEYGDFKVTVPVKKGEKAQTIFNAIESKVLAQQNGAMSIRGGEFGPRTMNPSVGFGIHRATHTTKLEKMEIARNLFWADFVEAQQQGAPDAIIKPMQKQLDAMDKAIEKERAKHGG